MFQYTPVAGALVLVAVLSAVAGYFGYQKRDRAGTIWYVWTMVSIAGWSLFLSLVVASRAYEFKLFFYGLGLVAIIYTCVTWFLFAVSYTGERDRLPRWAVRALLVSPLPYFVLAVGNDAHGLVFANPRLVTDGGVVMFEYGWGPLVAAYAVYSYALLAVATALFFRKALRSRNVYRKLSVVLGLAGVTMWFGNVLTFTGISPLPHMTTAPLGFLFWGVVGLFVFTSVRFVQMIPLERVMARMSSRFDDVLPLARDFVIEEFDSGVIITDADARIVDINSTARKMLDLDDRVVGKQIYDVVDVEQFFDDYEAGERVGDRREQVWIPTEDGEYCYDINVSEITDDGEVVGRSVMIYDITEQKERERQLREREEELRQQKQDLERQKQQLEHQNERLDRFASIVSHDLRNPLNVATGHVELLDAKLDDEHRQNVDELEIAHERMQDIIDDALTLARSGKAITEKEDVDVRAVATEAWENVDTDRASLDVDIDLRIESDPDRLLNVFENLFRNAIDHNDGAVSVRVGALTGDTGFYVEDDGAGIPEDERDHVLEQGYTTHEEGTGLGLSIVRDIVGAHGWELSITESTEGGARFEIECYSDPVDVETATA